MKTEFIAFRISQIKSDVYNERTRIELIRKHIEFALTVGSKWWLYKFKRSSLSSKFSRAAGLSISKYYRADVTIDSRFLLFSFDSSLQLRSRDLRDALWFLTPPFLWPRLLLLVAIINWSRRELIRLRRDPLCLSRVCSTKDCPYL